jgi:hypothetical protein
MLIARYPRRKKKIGRRQGPITARIQPDTEWKGVFPRHNGEHLTDVDILKVKLEEERIHLIEQVSALQAAQLEYEKAIEKVQRDREEQATIIVCEVPMERVVLTV